MTEQEKCCFEQPLTENEYKEFTFLPMTNYHTGISTDYYMGYYQPMDSTDEMISPFIDVTLEDANLKLRCINGPGKQELYNIVFINDEWWVTKDFNGEWYFKVEDDNNITETKIKRTVYETT